jgi:hypothetical protein
LPAVGLAGETNLNGLVELSARNSPAASILEERREKPVKTTD